MLRRYCLSLKPAALSLLARTWSARTAPVALNLLLAVLLLPVSGVQAAQPAAAIHGYSQMREIGYQIGDIATQTIHATTPPGYRLDRSSLPVLGEAGASLQLLTVDYRQQASGTQHTLRLRWQSFRAMQQIRQYALLPLHLQFRNGSSVLELALNAPSILVASLLPTAMDSEHALLRPAVKPARLPTRALKQQLLASFCLLSLTVGYLLWRYDCLPFKRKAAAPFRQAWRQLRRASVAQNKSSKDKSAKHKTSKHKSVTDKPAHADSAASVVMQMRTLRRAFDNSLGLALSAERLPLLYRRLPWLLPLQPDIDAFFAESERILFQPAGVSTQAADRVAQQGKITMALSRRLMLLESDAA